jgi:hypothetical protein
MSEREGPTAAGSANEDQAGDADLLTVGLVVFFVGLIVTVAALLLAPTLL